MSQKKAEYPGYQYLRFCDRDLGNGADNLSHMKTPAKLLEQCKMAYKSIDFDPDMAKFGRGVFFLDYSGMGIYGIDGVFLFVWNPFCFKNEQNNVPFTFPLIAIERNTVHSEEEELGSIFGNYSFLTRRAKF